jgi:UDP-glucuronate 4-epimerase
MKILVTGSAGFIGFHTALKLLERGDEVIGLDNFNPYYDVKLKNARNALLEKKPAFRLMRMDLCDRDAIAKLFAHEKFEVVCHLAAQAGVRYSLEHPEAYIDANIVGFLNVLEACRHAGVRRLVYASSSSVYGGNTKLPFSEADRVDNPVSLYAATKKADELMAHCYSHLYGTQTVGLRFFTVYGPWGRPDMAMWIFTKAILEGRPIDLFNSGDMQRDFTYVDDVIQGVVASIDRDGLDKCEIFNLGNHRSEKLLDLIAILETAMGKKAVRRMLPMQPGDVPATYADIERASGKLGFSPTTDIRAGAPAFVQWYREYHRC